MEGVKPIDQPNIKRRTRRPHTQESVLRGELEFLV